MASPGEEVRTKPVYLTKRERSVIFSMICIAEAGEEGEGDYQEFDYKAMDSVAKKLQETPTRPEARGRRKRKGETEQQGNVAN